MTTLDLLADRVRPVALHDEQRLPALAPLAAVLPGGGLRRGTVVALDGPGATTLLWALLAAPTAEGAWAALVGLASPGLVAAADAGVALERVAVVARRLGETGLRGQNGETGLRGQNGETGLRGQNGETWPAVVAALLDGFDLVVTAPDRRVRPADARRLAARARERGTVVVLLGPPARRGQRQEAVTGGDRAWPEAPDLCLTLAEAGWEGLGHGHGHLQRRRVRLEATGRREAARPRHADLWLPGDAAVVEPALAPDPVVRATGSGARTTKVA